MENIVFRLDDDKWSRLMVSGGQVYVSNMKYDSPVTFLDGVAKKNVMESKRIIPVAGITQLSMVPAEDTLKLYWLDEKGKEKSLSVDFDTEQDAQTVAEGVAAMRGMGRTTRGAGRWTALKTPVVSFLIIAALTNATYAAAVEIASGEEVEVHGRRAWLKLLLREIGRVLGPTGTVAIGGAICLGLLFWIYRRWRKPPMEHLWR